jgi:tetratricopeptide (TPR) repeat protein
VALALASCATLPAALVAPAAAGPAPVQAAEDFYAATTPEALRAAASRASAAQPDGALGHELEATLALLEGREADAAAALLAALGDPGDDQPLLHLHQLLALDFTPEERARVRARLLSLMTGHPTEAVRAAAGFHLTALLAQEGDLAGRARALEAVGGRVPLAWVGTWDNDQGKGFDLELPVESRPGLEETYEGRTGTLRWRQGLPTDPRGRYELSALMSPTRWSVAYAQGTLQAPRAGTYALRLSTTDPVKVWVDGALVFAAPQLERSAFDHLVLPLALSEGAHLLLVKSAHREGAWHLLARLVAAPPAPAVASVEAALEAQVRGLAPLRRQALQVSWAQLAVGGVATVKLADAFARAQPRSLVARTLLIDALWFNQERGRTADLLQALDAEVGDQLAFLRLRQTRFHLQQGLRQRARERLLELRAQRPELRDVLDQLAELWRTEGWTEDELQVLAERERRFGATPEDVQERARALVRLGRREAGLAAYRSVLRDLPAHGDALRRLADLELEGGDLAGAESHLLTRLRSWPTDLWAWLQLAEVRRRAGDAAGARVALEAAEALSPESSAPAERRGALAYERGDTAEAVREWKRAVVLNPENEALANRVDYLAPEARGPWMADLPDEAALAALVKARGTLRQLPGADVAYLLDHQVTLLNTDGSTSNVVSVVVHAWNAQGRDRIIRQAVGAGRLRVLQAYAVDERGQRSEASSERNRQIFFRGMLPGSTLVLQYRLDVPPRGFLARYFTETWSFQGVAEQRVDSTFILWTPLGTQLHEARVGELQRTEERRGEQLRVAWRATETPPITSEPAMPTLGELALNIHLSTVPDWRTWLSWEQALLEGVFRDSPELEQVARTLGEGAPDAEERLRRVHTYVMEEIRYQQDYETFIAGVKPHPAPMTLERRYGDCKDKAVLFIELARKLGVEAHFALVRTRDAGPVEREVPMQQFNHAIVYVPEQPGAGARFFDPTAELLDVDSMRTDDVGTRALVFDPVSGVHTWRDIPYQGPEANRERTTLELALDATGSARGSLSLEAVGRTGSVLRRTARNAEYFKQASQRIAAVYLPNVTTSEARAVEVDSLRVPARLSMKVESGTFSRREGQSLRLKLPSDANPRATFQLATRRHPLVLGPPMESRMEVALTLPEGFRVTRLPQSASITLPCLSLSREVTVQGRRVVSTQRYRTTCERLGVGEYPQYRARLDDLVRLLDDELVLGATGPTPAPLGPPAK